MNTNEPVRARILLAVESRLIDRQALQLAAEIAALWRSDLVAVCVAARALEQVPESPFASEIDRVSAAPRTIDATRLLHAFRIWRRQIDSQLARLAALHRISASSEVMEGRLWSDLLPAAGAADLLLVTGVPAFARHPTVRRLRRPIAMLLFGTEHDVHTIAVAMALGEGFHSAAVAFALAEDRAAHARIGIALAAAGTDPPRIRCDPNDSAQLVQRLDELGCRWIIASRTDVAAASLDLQPFLMRPYRAALLAP